MRKHSSMKPQDLVILLKIIALDSRPWKQFDLATSLSISTFEVSNALSRCVLAQLIDESKKQVSKNSLLEFLLHGVRYVFPVLPGGLVKGIATAHSAPPLSQMVASSEERYVWPDVDGQFSGQAIEPLHPCVPRAASVDGKLHEMLALVDALRVGKARERELASEQLAVRILPK